MKKPNSRFILTNNVSEIVSLSRNMKRSKGTMKFSTTEGNKRILSIEDLFTKRELSLRCLKTDTSPPLKYECRFEKAFDLGPLVQYFSWNDDAKATMCLGDVDFAHLTAVLELLENLESFSSVSSFTVSENPNSKSIAFFVESKDNSFGLIIDFSKDSNGITPFKIFGMNIPTKTDGLEIFYTSPQEGQKSFDLSVSLIEKYSVGV